VRVKFFKIIFLLIVFCFFNLQLHAAELKNIKYKNIKINEKINCIDGIWTNKLPRKASFYLVKKISDQYPYFTDFYSPNNEFLFSSQSHYEFINNGRLYAYSNDDYRLYEVIANDGNISKRIVTEDEIIELFPDFKLIRLTDFSQGTNSLKIKKTKKNLKLIIFNDTCTDLKGFDFSTNNAKIDRYPLKGFIDVTKKGMIQFSSSEFNNSDDAWFVLLVR